MDLQLADKIVLITGAARGIGAATAEAFAAEGARLILGDIDEALGRQTAEKINQSGGDAIFQRTDVTVEGDLAALVTTAVRERGGLDIAFNNAGITLSPHPVHDQPTEVYDRVMAINARGVWLGMKHELPVIANRGGAVVNMTSIAGVTATAGFGPYTASKHAIIGMTKAAALDYAERGVRVNAVGPGSIDTDMLDDFVAMSGGPDALDAIKAAHPLGRYGRAEEVAHAVLWLASPLAGFTTGTVLMIDGGFTAQ